MSRIPKWKLEKTKVKVVFRLQFHATHIPQPGWDKLFVSFIPIETGKATAKTTKANVRNGSCKWSDPLYETTRLLNDTRTKTYDEKLYKLVVAMGTSRSNLLGEVNINLSEYADALKPASVSLPLEGCEFGTVLHVTVQLLTSKTGFREFEKQREVGEKGFHMIPNHGIHEPAERHKASKGITIFQTDKADTRVRIKSHSTELSLLEEMGGSNEDYEDSAVGVDGSSCTSESIYTEKSDVISTAEVGSTRNTISGGAGGFPLDRNVQPTKEEKHDHRLLAEGSNDLAHGWSSDYSMDNDLAITSEENNRLRGSLEVAESSLSEFKMEVCSLRSLADELSAETNSMAQQLAGELASGEELAKEVSLLKSECLKFKDDLEELKHAKDMMHFSGGGAHSNTDVWRAMSGNTQDTKPDQFKDPVSMLHYVQMPPTVSTTELAGACFDSRLEVRTNAGIEGYHLHDFQIKLLNGLSLMEDKVKDIQSKAQHFYHEMDIDVLHSDFETLESVMLSLKQGLISPFRISGLVEGDGVKKIEPLISGYDMDGNSSNIMKEKICELVNELQLSKKEQENLVKKMNQMEQYYEALIQELEEGQKHTLNELDILKAEHSSCFYSISAFQTQMEKMNKDMNEQLSRFTEERHNLDSINKELEKRAYASETLLKKIRWNYCIAVDRLQKDLELLSDQVLSMFETNENLARQAFAEASQILLHELPEENSEVHHVGLHKHVLQTSLHEKQLRPSPTGIQPNKKYPGLNTEFSELGRNIEMPLHSKVQMFKYEGNSSVKDSELEKIPLVFPLEDINKNPVADADREKNYVLPRCAEEMKRSLQLLQDLHLKTEAELSEMHLVNINFDISVKVLQETLHEKLYGMRVMKEDIDELSWQLDELSKSKELLMLKLQSTMNNARVLSENEAKRIAEYDDLTLRNHILEAKLQEVTEENSLLSERLAGSQRMIIDYQDIETKYKVIDAEKNELENLLKQESVQKTALQGDLNYLIEDYKELKVESAKQRSVIDSLDKTVCIINDKMADLCSSIASHGNEISEPAFTNFSLELERDSKNYMAVMMHLEQLIEGAHKKILQLSEEKKAMEEQKNIAQASLNSTLFNLQEFMTKVDLSNGLVQKLQLELQDVAEKLKISLEAENMHAEKNKELSAKIMVVEFALQRATNENSDLVKKLLEFESLKEELERTKLSAISCTHEKERLMHSIQSRNETSIQQENEICSLKERLRSADDELQTGRVLRGELENAISELKFQLNEKCDQLLSSDIQKSEIASLRLQMSELELQKSALQNLLLQNEECQKKLNDEITSLRVQVFDLEKTVSVVIKKLRNLSITFNEKQINEPEFATVCLEPELENKNYKAIMMHLEQLLQGAHNKLLQLSEEKKEIEEQRDTARGLLSNTESSLQDFLTKLDASNVLVRQLQLKIQDVSKKLEISLEAENMHEERNKELSSKITVLEYELQQATGENRDLAEKMLAFESVNEELERAKLSAISCNQEKENLILCLQSGNETTTQLENEICSLKERLRCADDEFQTGRGIRQKLEDTISELKYQLNEKCEQLLSFDSQKTETANLSLQISELELQKSELQNLLLQSEAYQRKLNDETSSLYVKVSDLEADLCSLKESLRYAHDELESERVSSKELESRVVDLTLQVNKKSKHLQYVDEQRAELVRLRQHVLDLESEKSELGHLFSQSEECKGKFSVENSSLCSQVIGLENELRDIKESFGCTSAELQSERGLREELEAAVRDIRSELNDTREQLGSFVEQKDVLDHLRHCISDLEAENSELKHLLLHSEDFQSKLNVENSSHRIQVADLETQVSALLESLLTEEVKVIFISSQFQTMIQVLIEQLNMLEKDRKDLSVKTKDVIATEENFIARNAKHNEEDERSPVVCTLKSEYEIAASEKHEFVDSTNKRNLRCSQVEDSNTRYAIGGAGLVLEKHNMYEDEIQQLREMLHNFEECLDHLRSSRDELEITIIVLRSKLDEQRLQISSLEEYRVELMKLQEQNSELNYRLSEQILKAEEFKNLSIRLKELKDKADAECLQVREKKETEGPLVAVQESLRMAFIKEQCETKVQELRNQLHVSKMHGEELLVKLQNTLDEIEMRKKSEVYHLKKNEELSANVLELEAELQALTTSRRELVKACDGIKAELECSSISLDCCKEEKQKLEAHMRECNEERTRNRVELDLMKRRMEILTSSVDNTEQKSHEPGTLRTMSFGKFLEDNTAGLSVVDPQRQTSSVYLGKDTSSALGSTSAMEIGDSNLSSYNVRTLSNNVLHENIEPKSKFSQDDLVCGDDLERARKEKPFQENVDIREKIIERAGLVKSLELFHNELEKMKNENLTSLLPLEEHQLDPDIQGLQNEVSKLNTTNEHLGNMFPSYRELSGSMNAFERVLALELELAEGLQIKKSDVHLQSSFLKQHSDEEAIFQTFRDINELIKDMLDLKGRYAAVETELKEMHSRYSQLSLQFAEVEGERQKLIMTLKNRTPKKH